MGLSLPKSNLFFKKKCLDKWVHFNDVCAILGVSKTYAYSLMREYNKELKAKGYIVVAGKISTKFLAEKIYGMKVED